MKDVTLLLTEEEAEILSIVVQMIAGPPEGLRGKITAIDSKLCAVGHNGYENGKYRSRISGQIDMKY